MAPLVDLNGSARQRKAASSFDPEIGLAKGTKKKIRAFLFMLSLSKVLFNLSEDYGG